MIGELAAGVLLGPSVLGAVAPGAHEWLFPDDPRAARAPPGRRVDRRPAPRPDRAWRPTSRSCGASAGRRRRRGLRPGHPARNRCRPRLRHCPTRSSALGDARALRAAHGAALALSALPVIAKILQDLDLMRRNVGQILIAAAMVDDVVGWILLGAIAGAARTGSVDAGHGRPLRRRAAVPGSRFVVGQRLVDAAMRAVMRRGAGVAGAVATSLLIALLRARSRSCSGSRRSSAPSSPVCVLGRSRFHDRGRLPRASTS